MWIVEYFEDDFQLFHYEETEEDAHAFVQDHCLVDYDIYEDCPFF